MQATGTWLAMCQGWRVASQLFGVVASVLAMYVCSGLTMDCVAVWLHICAVQHQQTPACCGLAAVLVQAESWACC